MNATANETVLDEQAGECSLFLFINYVIIFGMICVFGLVGNFLSLVVMISERGSHVARFLLEVMAVTDNLFLATAGFAQIVQGALAYAGDITNPVLAYSAVIVWPLVHTTQMASVWMVMLVAFNRYIAICRPFQAPMLCTRKRVRIQIAAIAAFVVVYNIPRFCEHYLVYDVLPSATTAAAVMSEDVTRTSATNDNNSSNIPYYLTYGETALKKSAVYNIVYENILYCFFIFLGPLAVLIVMNTCLIRELAQVRQRLVKQNMPISGEEDEHGLTMTMIVIILVFIVCQTPAFFNQMLFLAIGSTHLKACLPYYYYYQLSNVLVSTNSSANFVIYCVFRQQFRERLQRLCFSCCPNSFYEQLHKRSVHTLAAGASPRHVTANNAQLLPYAADNDALSGVSPIIQRNAVTNKNGYSNSCNALELSELTTPLNPHGTLT